MKKFLNFLKTVGGVIFKRKRLKYIPMIILLLVVFFPVGKTNKLDNYMVFTAMIMFWGYAALITFIESWEETAKKHTNLLIAIALNLEEANAKTDQNASVNSMMEDFIKNYPTEPFDEEKFQSEKNLSIAVELAVAKERETAGMDAQEREMYFQKSNQAELLTQNRFKGLHPADCSCKHCAKDRMANRPKKNLDYPNGA